MTDKPPLMSVHVGGTRVGRDDVGLGTAIAWQHFDPYAQRGDARIGVHCEGEQDLSGEPEFSKILTISGSNLGPKDTQFVSNTGSVFTVVHADSDFPYDLLISMDPETQVKVEGVFTVAVRPKVAAAPTDDQSRRKKVEVFAEYINGDENGFPSDISFPEFTEWVERVGKEIPAEFLESSRVTIDAHDSWERPTPVIKVRYSRPETDEERNQRLARP